MAKQAYTADEINGMISGMMSNKANYAAAGESKALEVFVKLAKGALLAEGGGLEPISDYDADNDDPETCSECDSECECGCTDDLNTIPVKENQSEHLNVPISEAQVGILGDLEAICSQMEVKMSCCMVSRNADDLSEQSYAAQSVQNDILSESPAFSGYDPMQ